MKPKVSIIIPVKEINDYIREAVPRHLALEYPNFEVLILPDRDFGESFGPQVRIIPAHPKTGPADKRDIGARKAQGEILAFTDDDTYPHQNWLKHAVGYFEDQQVAAVCGPGVTPPSDSIWQKASGWVQASKLGGGNYTYRFLPQKKRFVDDYPSMNFIIRKSDFEKVGGFDSHFWPGEDTKLCLDLTQKLQKKIIYDPEVLVYHHRRPLFRPHLKQIGGYGLHRGHFARVLPQTSRRLSYCIPSLFTIFVFGAPVLGLLLSVNNQQSTINNDGLVAGVATGLPWYEFWLGRLSQPFYAFSGMAGLLGGTYFLLLLLTAVWVYSKERNLKVALLTIPGIFTTHIWYGLRFIRGFLSPKLSR